MLNIIKHITTAVAFLGAGTFLGGLLLAFVSDEKEANAWINGHQLTITLGLIFGFALPGLVAWGIQKLQDRNTSSQA